MSQGKCTGIAQSTSDATCFAPQSSGFAPFAESPYADEPDEAESFDFVLPDAPPPRSLPTIHSGAELSPVRNGVKAEGKPGKFSLFRSNSKRRELTTATNIEEEEVLNHTPSSSASQEPQTNIKAPSDSPTQANGGASPRNWWPTMSLRPSSGKAGQSGSMTVGSSPPDSPPGSLQGLETQPEAQQKPPTWNPFRRSLKRSKSESFRQRSVSMDGLPDHSNSGNTTVAKLETQPSAPVPLNVLRRANSQQLKSQHRRSKSGSQVESKQNAGFWSVFPGACTSDPKTAGDNDRTQAEITAPLINLGNLCFFVALVQCFSHTPKLRQILWRDFPEVPEPPKPPTHEPLSECTTSSQAKNAGMTPSQADAAVKDGENSPCKSLEASELSASSANQVARSSPTGSVVSVASSAKSGKSTSEGSPLTTTTDDDQASYPAMTDEPVSAEGQVPQADHSNGQANASSAVHKAAATKAAPNGTSPEVAEAKSPNLEVAETNPRVRDMCQRAREAAEQSPPEAGVLSQSLACVMAQMKLSTAPVNPFIAMYYAAQKAGYLINGMQQDIHEFWMAFKEILNADQHPLAGGRLEDIFMGKMIRTATCKKCQFTQRHAPEDIWDISMPPNAGKTGFVTVESSLHEFCNSSVNDLVCARCKQQEEESRAGKTLESRKSLVGMLSEKFSKKEEGMVEKSSFERLPTSLVIHLKRTQHSYNAIKKDDSSVRVNATLKLWNLLSDSAKETLQEEDCEYRLYACVLHIGKSATRGHYTAICRVGPTDFDWYKYDDEKKPVRLPVGENNRPFVDVKQNILKLDYSESREVCMCLYNLVERPNPSMVTE